MMRTAARVCEGDRVGTATMWLVGALVVACATAAWLGVALRPGAAAAPSGAGGARAGFSSGNGRAPRRTAVDAERARIARELHDIVSHNVSLMIVQAGAAREVLLDPARGGRGGAVGGGGRRAHHDDRTAAPARAAGARGGRRGRRGGADLAPQPSLSRLSPLIDRIAFAGLPVEVRISGEPRPLPSGIDVTAYRIVQEALTNALKHGAGGKAEVTIRYADRSLRVEVLTSGPSVLTGDGSAGTARCRRRRAGAGGAATAGRGVRRRPRRPPAARRRVPGPRPHPGGAPVTARPNPVSRPRPRRRQRPAC